MNKITVIIPAYNEESTIEVVLEKVRAQNMEGFEFEVIVIDDGSDDRTVEILEGRPELCDKLIKLPRNMGKGAAVKAGLSQATGTYILFQDADLEYDPADYAKLLLPVERFGANLVMGSRMVAPEYTRVAYFWHKIGNHLITVLFNILNNTTFTDIYSCYLLYRRDLLDPEKLQAMGWAQHAEILTRLVDKADNKYEVPISYHGRTYGEGKKIKAWHILSVIWTIVIRRFLR